MAKSKVGGSRAYIRGRIGADVYSVGKDGKGARQQVVRSLAEQVSNPRTESQMFGRMIMSTTMQAVSALSQIIDHSFDNVPSGQPSISEFIRRNYALIKADAVAHPASGQTFDLNKYQQKGVRKGRYVVSAGSAHLPSAVVNGGTTLQIRLATAGLTVGGLKTALGLSATGYITGLWIEADSIVKFIRVSVDTTLADDTAITSGNVASLFSVTGNVIPTISLDDTTIEFTPGVTDIDCAYGAIVSDQINGAWIHNNCSLAGAMNGLQPSNVALPTYPTGAAQFLNGGDL